MYLYLILFFLLITNEFFYYTDDKWIIFSFIVIILFLYHNLRIMIVSDYKALGIIVKNDYYFYDYLLRIFLKNLQNFNLFSVWPYYFLKNFIISKSLEIKININHLEFNRLFLNNFI